MSDLVTRLRKGFGTSAGRPAQVEAYMFIAHEAADRIEALESCLCQAREALGKMRFIETVMHDDYGMVDLFDSAHNVYLDDALAAIDAVLGEHHE